MQIPILTVQWPSAILAGFVPEGRNTSGVVTLRLAGGDEATGQLEVVQASSLADGWAAVCRTGFTRRMAMVGVARGAPVVAFGGGAAAETRTSYWLCPMVWVCLPGSKDQSEWHATWSWWAGPGPGFGCTGCMAMVGGALLGGSTTAQDAARWRCTPRPRCACLSTRLGLGSALLLHGYYGNAGSYPLCRVPAWQQGRGCVLHQNSHALTPTAYTVPFTRCPE